MLNCLLTKAPLEPSNISVAEQKGHEDDEKVELDEFMIESLEAMALKASSASESIR